MHNITDLNLSTVPCDNEYDTLLLTISRICLNQNVLTSPILKLGHGKLVDNVKSAEIFVRWGQAQNAPIKKKSPPPPHREKGSKRALHRENALK